MAQTTAEQADMDEIARQIRAELAIEAGFVPPEAGAASFHNDAKAHKAMVQLIAPSNPMEEAIMGAHGGALVAAHHPLTATSLCRRCPSLGWRGRQGEV